MSRDSSWYIEYSSNNKVLGKQRECFRVVRAGVENLVDSGDLWLHGGQTVEMNMRNESDWKRHFENIKTLVLVTRCGSKDMVKQAEMYVKCAKSAGVECILMVSKMGIEGSNNSTAKKFLEIEKCVKDSGLKYSICRAGFIENFLFLYSPMIMHSKLELPMNQDSKFAPINLCDVCRFVTHLAADSSRIAKANGECYKLTGQELLTWKQLTEVMNKALHHKVEYRNVDQKHTEDYLRKMGLPQEWITEIMDEYQVINDGKLGHVSGDVKKSVEKPITLEQFLKENASHFGSRS